MEFFNRKEEVLDLTLTKKGRELFSSGKFKPMYYSFHDADIIYESSFNEEQNDIVPRIKETPRLKQNINNYENSSNSKTILQDQKLYCELGGKTLSDQYKPAWQINFIKNPSFQFIGNKNNPTDSKKYEIKLSSSIDNNNSYQEYIPQIDIQTVYEFVSFVSASSLSDPNYQEEFYIVKDNPVLLNVAEYNSFENYENQEFTIEAFYVDGNSNSKSIIKDMLSFNENLPNTVFQYLNILFDKQAEVEQNVGVKDIYGKLIDKDDSKC